MHVEDLVLTGHLKQHPNGAHAVARKPTVRQVTHIDNSVKDSVVISHSRFDKSNFTATIKLNTNQPDAKPKQNPDNLDKFQKFFWWFIVPLFVAVSAGLIVVSFEHNWFGLADKFKLK